jgi:hypothetical protein
VLLRFEAEAERITQADLLSDWANQAERRSR